MILYYNEKSKDAVISVNSSTAQRPVSNVIDSRLTRVFRTEAATTTANIVFDMTTAVDVDCVAIAAHNITSGATIKLQGNASDVWTSPSVDETLTYNSDIITKVITSATYRYWRISIVDAANPDGYIQIGRAWIGEYYQMPGMSPSASSDIIDNSVISRSIAGQTYGDVRPITTGYSFTFPVIPYTEKGEVFTLFRSIGGYTPIFATFGEVGLNVSSLYATINQSSLSAQMLDDGVNYTLDFSLLGEV